METKAKMEYGDSGTTILVDCSNNGVNGQPDWVKKIRSLKQLSM